MIDPEMQSLVDAPLADPNKLYIPPGKKRALKRPPRPVYEGDFLPPKLKASELREREQNAFSAKLVAVLDYYATTEVPFERISEHTNLTVDQVIRAMSNRGRLA